MRIVDRTAMVPFSAAQMYALVENVECYPEFLPWCDAATLLNKSAEELVASLNIGFGSLNSSFTTRNQLEPPTSMTMELQDGPFSRLEGRWSFTQLGDEGCEAALRIEFEFSSALKDMLFGSTFEGICNELIDAFVKRANDLYSQSAV
jgi:ribosome-associated toxin RatA of RatAB toxin-antitoxin module